MAPTRSPRLKSKASRKESRRKTPSQREIQAASAADAEPLSQNPPDLDGLRKARLEHLDVPPEKRRKKMRYIGEVVERVEAMPVSKKMVEYPSNPSGGKRRRKASGLRRERRHDTVALPTRKADGSDEDEYVYRKNDNTTASNPRETPAKPSAVEDGESERPKRARTKRATHATEKVVREERPTPQRRQSEPVRRGNSYGIDECMVAERWVDLSVVVSYWY